MTGVTPNFAKGKLTKVTNGSASYEYRDFDALGRILNARQIIDGNNYDTSYSYNLAGALITETYPSGRTVTNAYNADGSLNTVSSRAPKDKALAKAPVVSDRKAVKKSARSETPPVRI